MKSNRKAYFILLSIIIIFFIVMYFCFARQNLEAESKETTIVVNNSSVWNLTGSRWMRITSNAAIANLNWKKFDIYLDSRKFGNYYLWYSDKWYLFDNDKNAVQYSGNLVAVNGNYDINFLNVESSQIVDYSPVDEVLSDNNLENPEEYTVSSIYTLDIDNDGNQEQLYLVSNVFSDDYYPETVFSIVFMIKDGEYKMLYNNITNNDGFSGCKPYVNAFLDVDRDKQYEVILSCAPYSNQMPTDMLYDYNNSDEEFEILISNQ